MNDSLKTGFSKQRVLAVAAVAGVALLCAGAAHADPMLVSDSRLMQGSASPSTVSYSFNVSGPGTMNVSLADVIWPTALSDLSFTVTSATSPLGQLVGAGSASFDISGAGTYYAYVTGQATNPSSGLHLNLGLYSLNISFSPSAVPLPASLGLFAAALACVGFLLKRRSLHNA